MRVLVIIPWRVPSTIINVEYPLQALQSQGHLTVSVRLEHEVEPQDILGADIIVLCRNTEPAYRPIYELAAELSIPIIYVLDDNIKGAPPGSASYRYHHDPGRMAHYEWLLQCASLVRIHSPALAQAIKPHNENISVVWAPVDWSLVPDDLPEIQPPLKIVYAAQPESGEQLFSLMRDDLHQILRRYPEQVGLHFMGYNPPGFGRYPNVVHIPLEHNYEKFFYQFTHAGYAIGLAPMLDTAFFRCKTDIKYRDYAAAGAAGIYMESGLYQDSVIHEETGLLISGQPGTWLTAIEHLLEDGDLLQHIRAKARQAVYQRYHMDVVGPLWLSDFAKLPQRPPLSEQQKNCVSQTHWRLPDPTKTLDAQARRLLNLVLPRAVKKRLLPRLARMRS